MKRLLPDYRVVEARVEQVIALKYGLTWPILEEVKKVDNDVLAYEAAALMPSDRQDEYGVADPSLLAMLPLLEVQEPWVAKTAFLRRWEALWGRTSDCCPPACGHAEGNPAHIESE